jgi:hypothetical protein
VQVGRFGIFEQNRAKNIENDQLVQGIRSPNLHQTCINSGQPKHDSGLLSDYLHHFAVYDQLTKSVFWKVTINFIMAKEDR